MTDFLQIAKPLVEMGFSVIPIEPGGKRPVPGLGALARTRDLSQVDVWAEQWSDANVAICADENIVILETDDHGQLEQTVCLGTGYGFLPKTLMACGSSENRPHLFFRRTEKATNVGNLVVPGLFECRFNNQYVVGVGSVHPSGAVYRWLNDSPVVPIPGWLVSELARLALSQKGSPTQREIQVSGGRVLEGSRHYFLMQELGRLWNGSVSETDLLAKAFELNNRCDPPKDEAHVRQCVRDIMRREPFNPGPAVVIGSGGKKKDETTSETFKYPAVPGRTRDYVLRPLHSPFDGWFPRGRVSIVGGSSGVGKTTLLVALLAAQRRGDVFLGHAGSSLPFLVLFADRTSLSNRETLERMNMTDIPIAYMPVSWDGKAVNNILDRIESHGCPAAVFVEGADALVSDANKAQVVAPFMGGLQKIAEWYHTALILSCGAPKQKPKEQYAQTRDRVFGSQMWARMAEDILILTYGTEGDDRHLIVEHRNARKEKFDLAWEDGRLVPKPPTVALTGVKETRQSKTDSQAEMIALIETLPPGTELPYTMFPWLASGTVSKNLRELSRPEARWVGRDGRSGKWIILKKGGNREAL